MYSCLIGSDTSHEKINYLCLNVPYIEANSVHWGSLSQSESCTLRHSQSDSCTLRPIPYIEADLFKFHWKSTAIAIAHLIWNIRCAKNVHENGIFGDIRGYHWYWFIWLKCGLRHVAKLDSDLLHHNSGKVGSEVRLRCFWIYGYHCYYLCEQNVVEAYG